MLEPRLILINLRVKLGVAAAVASALVRSVEFKSLLFWEERYAKQKFFLVLWKPRRTPRGERGGARLFLLDRYFVE